jgi:Transposase DDE domain
MRSEEADELMVRRFAIVEHPFGTLKCRAGYTHFLVRGFNKVRGEWSLMALCYNFTRVLNILGFDGFLAYLAEKARAVGKRFLAALVSALRALLLVLQRFCMNIAPPLEVAAAPNCSNCLVAFLPSLDGQITAHPRLSVQPLAKKNP